MNQVTFIGNLTRDVELRKTVNDSFVGSTGIAVRRDRKNDKGEYEADFFDVKLFGNQVDFASKYLRKGDKVCISGRIQIREYVNRDNVKCKAVEVLVNSIENLEHKDQQQTTAAPQKEDKPEQPAEQNLDDIDLPDDDLPF